MLLPSALSGGPRPRLQRFGAYSHDNTAQLSSPPITPTTPQGVDGTCHALQLFLGTRSHSSSRSPRRRSINPLLHANARILKRPPPRTRGHLKRTRDEEAVTDDEDVSDTDMGLQQPVFNSCPINADIHPRSHPAPSRPSAPSTPKRRRRNHTLSSMPFGLDASDLKHLEDEGVDVSMEGVCESPLRPSLDEGYGSMDITVGPQGDMFANLKSQPRPQLGTAIFAPLPDNGSGNGSDAMSISTPASDMAAMVLSPGIAINDPQTMTPELSRETPTNLPVLQVEDHDAKLQDIPMDTGSHGPAPELPTLPTGRPLSKDYYFRPRPRRTPSHIHSDPVDYDHAPASPPPTIPSMSETIYDWSHADDKALVDVVVDKLRLKKGDWDECARLLGADNGASLGRRWRELVGEGCVGMRFRYSGVGFTAEDAKGTATGKGKIRRGKGGRGDVRALAWS